MSILVDQGTRVLVQGITGSEAAFWTRKMLDMGTRIVAGVTPGKEGESVEGVPVFHTVARALAASGGADAAVVFVPPRFAADAVLESVEAGIPLVVTVADGIPLHEALDMRARALAAGVRVVGGNTSGVVSPGKAMLGMFPYWIERVYKPGRIGVMTRSGSLTNEVAAMVVRGGFGVSTLVGVGGDPVPGTRFAELLPAYEADPGTDAVVIIGELGGTMEEEVAEAVKSGAFSKPVVAFIAGRRAPEGRKMGHAGAVAGSGSGRASDKIAACRAAGILVADVPSQVGSLLGQCLPRGDV
jgi:succinyl-CoA synthetase alpha subunit